MRESQLEEEIKQAEEVYEGLAQTLRSLGTMFAETLRRGKDLDEFRRHLRDLPLLTQQADLRRTELRYELLDRRATRANDKYRRAAEELSKAARELEQARSAYLKAEEAARRSGLEARRLAELRDKESLHLQELRRVAEDAQRYQGEQQRAEQSGEEQGRMREGDQGAQEQRQGEERVHDPSQEA